MKKIVIILCLLLAVTGAAAQQAKLSLPRQEITLSELFREIERQTGSVVVFDADKVALGQQVSLQRREGTVAELLDGVLPEAGYTWQTVDRYIVVRVAPAPVVVIPPQPSRAEFERDVRDYSRSNIPQPEEERVIYLYDTIRTVKPHSGVFRYPSREVTPGLTQRAANTPFTRNTPPIFAIKTNLAWWAARGTLNIAGEIGLGKRTSLELAGGINRWNLKGSAANNKKLSHWIIKPEFRYWLCERFSGHFFGLHAFYGQYNVGGYNVPMLFDKEFRYEGDAFGAGINYGYHWAFAKRWGLEFTAGVGMIRMNYKKSDCVKCGSEVGRFNKTLFGPTNLGLKLIFIIK